LKLSLVVPARNEAASLPSTLAALAERLAREAIDYEIVVVDDGSTDGTDRAAREYGRSNPRVVVVSNAGPHGYGRAVALGLSAFTGEAVVIVMADGSDDPADVVAYHRILEKRADCAFGSRWIAGGRVVDYPWAKRWLNRAANTFIRLLFGLRYDDVTNAFKGYRREVIDGCRPLLSPHFNLTVELPLKAIVRGFSHEVVPIRWYNRRQGISKLRIEEMGSRYLYIVLIVWLEKLLTRGDYRRPGQTRP
jgi:dolichol-phosphate mannosyltransferase